MGYIILRRFEVYKMLERKEALQLILKNCSEKFEQLGFTSAAVCENGDVYKYNGSCLLCAVCNGEWCGGSFHNSPASNMSDGVIEMMLVKKMSRLKSLRSDYPIRSKILVSQIWENFI